MDMAQDLVEISTKVSKVVVTSVIHQFRKRIGSCPHSVCPLVLLVHVGKLPWIWKFLNPPWIPERLIVGVSHRCSGMLARTVMESEKGFRHLYQNWNLRRQILISSFRYAA